MSTRKIIIKKGVVVTADNQTTIKGKKEKDVTTSVLTVKATTTKVGNNKRGM